MNIAYGKAYIISCCVFCIELREEIYEEHLLKDFKHFNCVYKRPCVTDKYTSEKKKNKKENHLFCYKLYYKL